MVPLFGSNTAGICLIFNYVLDYVYNWFSHLLNSLNQDILELNNLALYCSVTHQKRAHCKIALGLLMEQFYEFLVQKSIKKLFITAYSERSLVTRALLLIFSLELETSG